jgi:competence protein ComEC
MNRSIRRHHIFWSLALFLSMVLAHFLHRSEQVQEARELTNVKARVRSFSPRGHYSFMRLSIEGHLGQFMAVSSGWDRFEEGDELLISGQITAPRNFSSMTGVMKFSKPATLVTRETPGFFLSLRQRMAEGIRQRLPGELGGLTVALFLGDRSDYFGPRKKSFQLTGTLHYLALSGLHLGLVLLPFILLFRSLRVSPRWQLMAAVPVMIFYLCLVGPIPSLLRAFVSYLVVVTAIWFDRQVDRWNALCAVAVFCLLMDFRQVNSAGFFMTFFALGGIVFIGPRLLLLLPEKAPFFWKAVAYNTGAWLGIAPVLLYFFNEICPSALILNVLLIPVFTLMMGSCVLFYLWPDLFAWVLKMLWGLTDFLLQFSLNHFEGLWAPARPHLAALIWIVALGVFLLMKSLSLRAQALLVLTTFLVIRLLPLQHAFEGPRVTQLNVGQGSCYLIEVEEGKGFLVDCGGASNQVGERSITPSLRRNGVKTLSHIFITHLDDDHHRGLEDILARFHVGVVVTSPMPDDKRIGGFKKLLKRYRVPHLEISRGDVLAFSAGQLQCLHPGPNTKGPANERSLVLRLLGAKKTLLFTGDIDEGGTPDLLLAGLELKSDILTAPHHGSRNRYFTLLLEETGAGELWLSARKSFPKEEAVLNFPKLKKSWRGEVESDF